MENASEALIMAGQMLIFIVALSVCISSFTTVRVNIDEIIGQTETVEFAKDSKGYINYIESRDSAATRIVGSDAVVSSMYRSMKENYAVFIKLNDTTGLTNVILCQLTDKAVINNKTKIKTTDKLIYVTTGVLNKVQDTNYPGLKTSKPNGLGQLNNNDVDKLLKDYGLYTRIKELNFMEYQGEYQQDTGATFENRDTFRIITYVEV